MTALKTLERKIMEILNIDLKSILYNVNSIIIIKNSKNENVI